MERDQLILAVWDVLNGRGPPSECKARCYLLAEGPQRQKCLDACAEQAAVAAVAERLKVQLFESIVERIWKGGNIDPRPFEAEVRAHFAQRVETTPINQKQEGFVGAK